MSHCGNPRLGAPPSSFLTCTSHVVFHINRDVHLKEFRYKSVMRRLPRAMSRPSRKPDTGSGPFLAGPRLGACFSVTGVTSVVDATDWVRPLLDSCVMSTNRCNLYIPSTKRGVFLGGASMSPPLRKPETWSAPFLILFHRKFVSGRFAKVHSRANSLTYPLSLLKKTKS